MQTIQSPGEISQLVDSWHEQGLTVAFVPSMGNLHDGHLHLVEIARQKADKLVVSIYVNPTQFGENEDFDLYPRTLKQDLEKLLPYAVDAVFTPTNEGMYPQGYIKDTAQIDSATLPSLYSILEGAHRPSHFQGVARVVSLLFDMVKPDIAVFGEKDFQQLLVIRQLVKDKGLPIEIIGVPTVREVDGLAMSSRNAFLSSSERADATLLYQVLQQTRDRVKNKGVELADLEQAAISALERGGLQPNYVAIRDTENLQEPYNHTKSLVILAAVRCGATRLIDNIKVETA